MKTYWVNEGGRYEHSEDIHSSEFLNLNCSDSAVSAQLSVLAETDEDISAPIVSTINDIESPMQADKNIECSVVPLPSPSPSSSAAVPESAKTVSTGSDNTTDESSSSSSPVDDDDSYEKRRRLGAQMRAEKLRKVFEKIEAVKQQQSWME